MKRSTERILTTHAGSLPRPPELVDILTGTGEGAPRDEAAACGAVRSAVRDAVRRQVEAGVDVVSDGEMSKRGFANYVLDRMTGFGGQTRPLIAADIRDFPDFGPRLTGAQTAPPSLRMPGNDGPISYVGRDAVAADVESFRAALEGQPFEEAFLPAATPGCVVQIMATTHYGSRRDYLYALADALAVEYGAVVGAGFLLQVDGPDLAMGRHVEFAEATIEEYRANLELHVEGLNHALGGIDPEQVRVHVCWGNYPGPHHRDVPLRDILDIVYKVNAGAISIEAANPRHAHEWRVFEEMPLPEGRVLIPGVIESCSNYIEHPELVAERIERFAHVVGRENVIAGTDCGFGTFAGLGAVAPPVAYAKLQALAEGARLASAALWR